MAEAGLQSLWEGDEAMKGEERYWNRTRVGRRAAVRGAGTFGGGLAALSLIGCRDGTSTRSSTGAATGGPSAAPAASVLDPTKGKPGGVFLVQRAAYPNNLDLPAARQPGAAGFAGLTHSGLLSYRAGRPGVDGTDISVEPDVALAMPEQPDPVSHVYKIVPGIKFHNGRTLTAEDVKYSLDRYAFWDRSAFRESYSWLDKVEAPNAETVIVKTKAPFADAVQSLAVYNDAFILAKEFEESPEVATKQMGSGPYLWGGTQPPISTTFRRNPEYFRKPYPYFDEIQFYVSTDDAKKVADFSARNLHLTWWNPVEPSDQIRQSRPDAQVFEYPASGYAIIMRVDQPPFNDKRVRQALSMAIDRKRVREGVSQGQGEDDQVFSIINKPWGFRRPRELKAARNWNFDPAEAKKLLSAAGIDKPIEATWTHWDASVNGQATVDMAVLIQAKYRELGIANIKDVTVTSAQYMSTVTVGQFDMMAHGPNQQNVVLGLYVRNVYWSPPEGVKAPTVNAGHVNDPRLSQLLEKQLGQFDREERKSTFREIEEIMAEEQYRIILSTYTQTWFADPSVKNIQVPIFAYNGAADYMKYWWFEKA